MDKPRLVSLVLRGVGIINNSEIMIRGLKFQKRTLEIANFRSVEDLCEVTVTRYEQTFCIIMQMY